MTDVEDGGSAFPSELSVTVWPGMSLRDWFAGQALADLAARTHWESPESDIADRAYALADAMIAERGQ